MWSLCLRHDPATAGVGHRLGHLLGEDLAIRRERLAETTIVPIAGF